MDEVWLPDCKTLDPSLARSLRAPPTTPGERDALACMVASRPAAVARGKAPVGADRAAPRGARRPDSTREVLAWFRERLYGRALLSLMVQYTPNPRAGKAGLTRRVSGKEYDQVLGWLEELGIEEGFIQEPEPGPDWLPDFSRREPFPEGQARAVWHFGDSSAP